jgi:two-component system, NarL family, response regulator DevR
MPVRIVLADDHDVVRIGIKALLNQHPGFVVVGEAKTGEEAIKQVQMTHPNIVIMDIRMPGMSGIDACRQIVHQAPDTHVIMLTSYAEDHLLFSAVRAGAVGYLLKRIGSDDLFRTIERVACGEVALDPDTIQAVLKQANEVDKSQSATVFSALADQEMRILVLLAEGLPNREIAQRLFLSEGTVRNYVTNILSKLHLSNRAEAAAFAVAHDIKAYVTIE